MTVSTPQPSPPAWQEEALPLPGPGTPVPAAPPPASTEPTTAVPAFLGADGKPLRPAKPATPRFADLVSFVQHYLAPATDTRLGGPVVWCPRWWEHPAAAMRLKALWHSWEVLRLQPGGTSTWWVQHYDPHMRALLDADRGPFYRCHKTHTPPQRLRTETPPPDWRSAPVLPSEGA